ncbi:ribose 5-phosphate isomerase B [Desulfosoma caldarium]|uniref:Ribose 5-phosphate isomerase B n=1 Tax=Desulfosoma caldarium TaxID=610254 RepID=A0A3N1ULP9_9BACT|nr:ribose 5-phosphate isomerase B [Desulfosoma caldarium]ROQ90638.1 ribose 5-phosphate isomerase B [Desulfosoma caldarium]
MKIMIGADHAGFELKEHIVAHLRLKGHHVEDIGTHSSDSVDYPDYAFTVARAVAQGMVDRGILLCGSGIGMSMAANRVPGVRAVLASEPYAAKMSRRHNDSNVLCLGGRFIGPDLAREIVDVWLAETFEGGRHCRRLDLLDNPSSWRNFR